MGEYIPIPQMATGSRPESSSPSSCCTKPGDILKVERTRTAVTGDSSFSIWIRAVGWEVDINKQNHPRVPCHHLVCIIYRTHGPEHLTNFSCHSAITVKSPRSVSHIGPQSHLDPHWVAGPLFHPGSRKLHQARRPVLPGYVGTQSIRRSGVLKWCQ